MVDLLTGAAVGGPGVVCGACGRPLADPRSIAVGIGPVCAGKGRGIVNKGEIEMEHRATYTVSDQAAAIVVEDRGGGRSVTNGAEEVIEDLRARGLDLAKPVIYRDTMGRWDVLRVADGRFDGFAPLGGAETFPEAVLALKARAGDFATAAAAGRALAAVQEARRDPVVAALDLDTWTETRGTIRRTPDGTLRAETEDGTGFALPPGGRR